MGSENGLWGSSDFCLKKILTVVESTTTVIIIIISWGPGTNLNSDVLGVCMGDVYVWKVQE